MLQRRILKTVRDFLPDRVQEGKELHRQAHRDQRRLEAAGREGDRAQSAPISHQDASGRER